MKGAAVPLEQSGFFVRPEILSLFVAGFIIGLEAAFLFPERLSAIFLWLAFAGGLLLVFTTPRQALIAPLFLFTALSTGIGVHWLHTDTQHSVEAIRSFDGASVTLSGIFSGELKVLQKGGYRCQWEDVRGEVASQTVSFSRKVRVDIESSEPFPEPGQRYSATGTLRVDQNGKVRLVCNRIEPAPESLIFSRIIGRLQQWVRDGSRSLLSPRHQALNVGLLLGDTSQLSLKDRRMFRDTGLTHLLAVSGQHVMVLALLLAAILTWSGIPPLSRGLISILFLAVFGFMAAGQPSVWRAVVMYATGILVWNLEANPGPIRPIALAALLLLIWNPGWIHHIGFQLSFLAVLGIILGRPPIEQILTRFHLPLLLARYLAISLGANLATLPLAAYHFGTVSLVSFFINPLVVWSFGILLPLGIVLVFLGHVWFSGALLVAASLSLAFDAFIAVVEAASRIPAGVLHTGHLPGFLVAGIYACFLYLLWEVIPTDTPQFDSEKSNPPKTLSNKSVAVVSTPISNASVPSNLDQWPVSRLTALDKALSNIPRRSLKTFGNLVAITFPLQKLRLESQTLFYRLDDLSAEVLRQEPQRIRQAHTLCLTLLAIEILARLPQIESGGPVVGLNSSLPPLQSRHLTTILVASRALQELQKIPVEPFGALIRKARQLMLDGSQLFADLETLPDNIALARHQAFKARLLEWCRETVAIA